MGQAFLPSPFGRGAGGEGIGDRADQAVAVFVRSALTLTPIPFK
jgi:hypothetical protein